MYEGNDTNMQMIIGGKKVNSSDGKTIEVVDPSTLKVIDTVPAATFEDIDLAVSNAVKGFGEWSEKPLHERITVMKKFLALYDEHRDELIDYVTKEGGKPIKVATGEYNYTRTFFDQYIEQSRFVGGETLPINNLPSYPDSLVMTVREPLGVVVGVLPFNFPLSQVPHKAVAPLLMGNSVILKPSSNTPLVQIRLVELFLKAGVPANAIQIVTGSGAKVGTWLSSDKRVAMISLTGSTEVGIEISKDAAQHLHHVKLELGGNDPLIVLPDADLDYAVAQSMIGRNLGNAGQACCASKRFIVHNSIKEAYTQKLVEAIKKLKVTGTSDPDSDCGPLISLRHAKEVEEQIKKTIEQGGKLVCGGKRENAFVEITAVQVSKEADVAKDMEIFGPVFPIIGYDTVEEAVEIANNTIYGLSSGVIGKDMEKLFYVAKRMQAGCCTINGNGNVRRHDQPFGGYKMTGIGREGTRFTLEENTQLKTLFFLGSYK